MTLTGTIGMMGLGLITMAVGVLGMYDLHRYHGNPSLGDDAGVLICWATTVVLYLCGAMLAFLAAKGYRQEHISHR